MRLFRNRETGELLTEFEAERQFEREYDGFDPTNILNFDDYYEDTGFEQLA